MQQTSDLPHIELRAVIDIVRLVGMAELAINDPDYQLFHIRFYSGPTERSVPNELQKHPAAFQSH